MPWITKEALANAGSDDLESGDVQPLDSRFKLKGDVIGSEP